jgi:hypothetical protein
MTIAQARSTYLAVVCPAGATATVLHLLLAGPASKISKATADEVHPRALTGLAQVAAEYRAFTRTDPAWPQNVRADIANLAGQVRIDKDWYQRLAAARTGLDMFQIWNAWPSTPQSGLAAWPDAQRKLGLRPGTGC